ncbi:MAG: RsmD family RNA methyltransferase [Actinomycetota bacterium]|nr:RsmD family RNA methyltransferase [Actinomycetota bacterium]MDH5225449.1 RsmD family RNA methyltransferase [Actinomycetota bacterium]MDH5312269.1 RsmD family RNA methyltransferase [Actinomycetota bacterium]
MRIVAGSAKGVRLGPVPPAVRPISDRAREGLFSSLGPDALHDAVVLDLFSGTGAAGIEALSRGAARAAFVDRAPASVSAIKRNLVATKLGHRGEVFPSSVTRFLARDDRPGGPYDLVICDPPYDLGPPELDDALQRLAGGWLRDDAWTVVLTRGHKSSTPVIPLHWALARRLRYGDSLVMLFRPRGSA